METRILKTIIVDDEQPSREALVNYVRDFVPGVEVVAECDSVQTAYKAIMKHQPDLVFLDIEMPNGNGFDLLKMFKNPRFKVIFITAFSEYAIRAFRFSASDYLLKPVKVEELQEAVEKVRQDLEKEHTDLNLKALLENLALRETYPRQMVIHELHGSTVIKISELIYCEADSYCTHFYLTGKRKVTSAKNLKHYEEMFDKTSIIKVHRSYLVNMDNVRGYTHQGEIFLEEGLKCPLGEKFKAGFLERIGKGK